MKKPKPLTRNAPKPPSCKLPVLIACETAQRLREICGAAGLDGGADGFAQVILGDMLDVSLLSRESSLTGVPAAIMEGWPHDDPGAVAAAMQAVVDRWNERKGGVE